MAKKKTFVPTISDKELGTYAKALAGAVFRNGEIENLHAAGTILDDETMNILNHDVCNRIYGILKMLTSGDPKQYKILNHIVTYNRNLCAKWDDPVMPEEFEWDDRMLEIASHSNLYGGKKE